MVLAGNRKAAAIAGATLSCFGFAYQFVASQSFITPIFILGGTGLAVWAARGNPKLWKSLKSDSSLDVGDLLLLAGMLTGALALNFLNLPTASERGMALIAPTGLFATGIFLKTKTYFRRSAGQNKSVTNQ